ncbi:hypothetical protein N656DRAFT_773951 [Canariomyces notabilis]|uniref:Uncharacterized protein n=1 Tax=Canariomyces notabilis TaxID=2074819 RepID=A0AAN6TNJ6_9PEZI|nr:hypothetical protein N656DRAFT_773951 [Canariomyces arenarius]
MQPAGKVVYCCSYCMREHAARQTEHPALIASAPLCAPPSPNFSHQHHTLSHPF